MKKYILVCTSHKPKVCGGGCCNDKGGEELLAKIQDRIESQGLSQHIEAKSSACLSNCKEGISLKTLPDRDIHSKCSLDTVDALLEAYKPTQSV